MIHAEAKQRIGGKSLGLDRVMAGLAYSVRAVGNACQRRVHLVQQRLELSAVGHLLDGRGKSHAPLEQLLADRIRHGRCCSTSHWHSSLYFLPQIRGLAIRFLHPKVETLESAIQEAPRVPQPLSLPTVGPLFLSGKRSHLLDRGDPHVATTAFIAELETGPKPILGTGIQFPLTRIRKVR